MRGSATAVFHRHPVVARLLLLSLLMPAACLTVPDQPTCRDDSPVGDGCAPAARATMDSAITPNPGGARGEESDSSSDSGGDSPDGMRDSGRACAPVSEVCDGRDNDCDGEVDEDCRCDGGTAPPCNGCPAGTSLRKGWVCVPAGALPMGSDTSEQGHQDETRHTVSLTRPFLLKATEVTQAEWTRLMGTQPSVFANCGQDCPVESVSWTEAVAYCNAMSQSEGLPSCYADEGGADYDAADAANGVTPVWREEFDCAGYRLPSEAEWEYAARAGTLTPIWSGALEVADCLSLDRNLDLVGWYCGNSGVQYPGCSDLTPGGPACAGVHPVGQKAVNPWGLYDVHGNVAEFTWDWVGSYTADAAVDPIGPSSGLYRVRRGGGWRDRGQSLRSAARIGGLPADRTNSIGLRPARSVLP
jgi:formylglycine-generating enzyme required for sulfatase activity